MEAIKIPDADFETMIVRMPKDLSGKMDDLSER